MRKLAVLLFLSLISFKSKADTFVVTSNGDIGTGTLRNAINLANANPTGTPDYIYFNLPGSTAADMTITLLSELPILTSNIVIDGRTQSGTSAFGHPNIKIHLTKSRIQFFHALRLDNADGVKIYGLIFSNFNADPNATTLQKKGAIFLSNSSDITIGSVDGPNCFMDNYAGVLALPTTPAINNTNIHIKANIFGLDAEGKTAHPNERAIAIAYLKNSRIGGSDQTEGNLITSNAAFGIYLESASGDLEIINNTIGLDGTKSSGISSLLATGIYVSGSASVPAIRSNIIALQQKAIMLEDVNGGFVIATNSVGTGAMGNENLRNEIGIHVKICNKGMIGGNSITAENKIANNDIGVIIDDSYPISILKNSFYCNLEAIQYANFPVGVVITQSRISTISPTMLAGKYLPNAKVELFYSDLCPGTDCQGKTWFATLPTDANGLWTYNGPITGNVTSMGTNPDGATSTFSRPYIDDSEHVPLKTICGQQTGSITKMKVYDANVFEWTNQDGQVVGNTLDIYNLPAGTYYLRTSQNGSCPILSTDIEVASHPVIIDETKKSVQDATCSAYNGSITGITVSHNLKRKWYEQDTDKFMSDEDNLINVPHGLYYFIVGSGSCAVRSTTYAINNNAAYYEMKEVRVSPVTCGAANGKIDVIGYPSTSTFTFKWFDESNHEIGDKEILENVGVGQYKFIAYSAYGCATEVGIFRVDEAPLPNIDYTNLQQFISCDGKTVSTSGIIVEGSSQPFIYRWVDENDNLVSNLLNLSGVRAGRYKLNVIDNNGCLVEGGWIDFTTLKNSTLVVPNSITPNGDGVNDVWQISGAQNYVNADFSIFSRDGNRVFYSRGYPKPFDGQYNGKLLPTGVYYYVIDLKTDCGKISGSLTILR